VLGIRGSRTGINLIIQYNVSHPGVPGDWSADQRAAAIAMVSPQPEHLSVAKDNPWVWLANSTDFSFWCPEYGV